MKTLFDYYPDESELLPGESGLFAGRNFKKGEVIGYFQIVPVPEELESAHTMWLDSDNLVLVINDVKYANHSASPNCDASGLLLYAARDVKKDEELFWDYGEEFEESIKS